jgi:hypothetical protein
VSMRDFLEIAYSRSLADRYADMSRELHGLQKLITFRSLQDTSRANPIVLDGRTKVWHTYEQEGQYYVHRDNWERRVTTGELYTLLLGWGFIP